MPPTSLDVATFDTTLGGTDTNSTIDAAYAGPVGAINVTANYTQTITDALGIAVDGATTLSGGTFKAGLAAETLSAGLAVSGGTFTGSSGVVNAGGVSLTSGTLTAPSTTLTVDSGNWAVSGGTFTAGTGTVDFGGIGIQTLNSGGQSFNNLSHDVTDTVQVTTNALTVGGTLTNSKGNLDDITTSQTITVTGLTTVSGGTFQAGAATLNFKGGLTVSGGTFTGANGVVDANGVSLTSGTLTAPSTTLNDSGNWAVTGGTFTAGTGTVAFTGLGLGVQTLASGGQSFNNINMTGTDTLQITANPLTVGGALTVSGGTLDDMTTSQLITVTGLTTVSGGSFLAGAATLSLNGGLTVSGGTFTGSGGMVNANDVTLSSATLSAPSGAFNVSGNWSQTGGTFTAGLGTVTFNSNGSQTLDTFGTPFNNVDHSGAGTLQLVNNPLTANGTLSNAGTLDLNGQSLSVTGAFTNTGTTELQGTEVVTLATGNDVTEGTWLFYGNNTAGPLTLPFNSYFNLTIDDEHATKATFQASAAVTVAGSFNLAAGDTLDLKNNSLTVTGNAVIDGTLNGLTALAITGATTIGTAAITSTGTQTYSGPATLGADTTLTATTVTFGSTVAGGGNILMITGNAAFNGAVAGVKNLTVSGTTTIDTASITTTGTQIYSGAVTLSADTTLTATTVTFSSTITGGGHSLAIVGATAFNNAVTGLSTLSVSGATSIGVAAITTTGTQTYSGPVTLFIAPTLKATKVTFGSTVAGGGFDLTITGDAEFDGDVSAVANLSVSGASTIAAGAIATTGGTQTYTGAVTVMASTTLTATTVNFMSTVTGLPSGANTLGIVGDVNFDDVVTGLSTLSVMGATAINTATITTTGTQTYNGPVTLSLNPTTLTASTVTFKSTLAGGNNALIVTGGAEFDGAVTNLASLAVSGVATIDIATITTTGNQTYSGGATLQTNVTLTAPTVTFGPGATVGNSNNLTITGNAVFNGDVAGVNILTVSGATTLNTANITSTAAGTQTYTGVVTLAADTALTASTVTFSSTITGGGNSLAITGAAVFDGAVAGLTGLFVSGPTTINTAMIMTVGAQTYHGAVTLLVSPTLTASTVTFASTVAGNGFALIVTGGAVFDDTVSGLATLSVSGATTIDTATITTTGIQTYGGAVTLSTSTTLTTTSTVTFDSTITGGANHLAIAGAVVFEGAVTGLTTLAVSGATTIDTATITSTDTQTYTGAVTLVVSSTLTTATTVTFVSTVAGGGNSLTINGAAAFDGAVTGLTTLAVAGATSIDTATITSTGTQTYSGPVTLLINPTLTATTVTFGSTVDGGGNSLVVVGGAVFNGVVTGVLNLSVTGATTIDTMTIMTTGGQTYGGPVTLLTPATLTASTVLFNSTITGGSNSLAIVAAVHFDGVVTGLTTLSVTGSTAIDTSAITSLGTQTYNGAVTVSVDATLTASTVTFDSTVTGAATRLTIAAGAVFNGVVSGFSTLAVDATTTIDTATITTTGGQTYTGPVTLMTSTILTASTAAFGSTVAGGFALAIAGNADFNGAVTGLTALSVSAATTIDTPTITTTGAQTYTGAATLEANVTLTAVGITFGGTIDADSAGNNRTLTFVAGGDITLAGSVGGNQVLAGLTILSANNVTASGAAIDLAPNSSFNMAFSGVGNVAAAIMGAGVGVNMEGSGSLTLGNVNNTYTGTTAVYSGTLTLAKGAKLSLNSSLVVDGTAGTIFDVGGNNQTFAAVTLIEGQINDGTVTNNTTTFDLRNGTVSAVLAGSVGLGMTGGTVTLSSPSTYTGGTFVNAGTLNVVNNALPTTTTLTVAANATFNVSDAPNDIAVLAGSGSIVLNGGSTLTVGGTNVFSTFAGVISGAGGLTKAGTASFFLTGASPYSGPTNIDNGFLVVTGSVPASLINVNTSLVNGKTVKGYLNGTGHVGNVVVNGGIIDPGQFGTSILTIDGTLTFENGGAYAPNINGTTPGSGYDQLVVNGPINLGSGPGQPPSSPGSLLSLNVASSLKPALYTPFTILANKTGKKMTNVFSGTLSNGVSGTPDGLLTDGSLVEGSDGNLYFVSYAQTAAGSFAAASTNTNDVVVMRVSENFAFVRQLYRDLLNRTGAQTSIADIKFWAGFIDDGVASKQQVADAILMSPDYRAQVVNNDYETFLRRLPRPDELTFYTTQPALSAFSSADIAFAILTSPEYNALHPDVSDFVQSLYANLGLQSGGGPFTPGFWVGELTGASLTRMQVVTGFLGSQEVFNLAINSYYNGPQPSNPSFPGLLRRPASPGEIAYWDGQFQPGKTNANDIINLFLTSPEYLSKDVQPQPPTIP